MNIQMIFGKPCNDYAAVLQHFAGTKTSSNKTSSLPLAQFWKDAATRLTALETALQMPLQNAVLCFEYPTAPAQGRGKASMTDLMILSGNRQVSIEAKYTEYSKMRTKTVSDWLNKSDTDNRQKVLAGWWNMIAPFRHNTETPDEIGYQFLHRTASACNGATQAAVIYLLFYDNDTQPFLNRYKPLLEQYVRMIAPKDSLKFYIWEVPTTLKADKNAPSQRLFAEMKTQNIYEFGNPSICPLK